jgi:hypothetical protein
MALDRVGHAQTISPGTEFENVLGPFFLWGHIDSIRKNQPRRTQRKRGIRAIRGIGRLVTSQECSRSLSGKNGLTYFDDAEEEPRPSLFFFMYFVVKTWLF